MVDLSQEHFRFADAVGHYVAKSDGRFLIEEHKTWSGAAGFSAST